MAQLLPAAVEVSKLRLWSFRFLIKSCRRRIERRQRKGVGVGCCAECEDMLNFCILDCLCVCGCLCRCVVLAMVLKVLMLRELFPHKDDLRISATAFSLLYERIVPVHV